MAKRDTLAFAEFVAARSPALFRSAYLMVGDHGLAQDLVQEALTKTYVARPRPTTYVSWWRRKSWAAERPRDDVPDRGDPRAADGHGLGVVDRAWLWQELQSLPPRERAAIVLRYYEDLTEAQTAEAMGCAVGTVKSQVAHGLKRLRAQLGDDTELRPMNEMAMR